MTNACAIGTTFIDPLTISTTTDVEIACNFSDTLFVIYASEKSLEALGAVGIDSYLHTIDLLQGLLLTDVLLTGILLTVILPATSLPIRGLGVRIGKLAPGPATRQVSIGRGGALSTEAEQRARVVESQT